MADFNLPHLHLVRLLGVILSEFQKKIFGIKKLESMGYPTGLFACHMVRLAVLTNHRLVTSQGIAQTALA